MRKSLHLLMALIVLCTACRHGGDAEAIFTQVDSIVETRPDSAISLLGSLDTDRLDRRHRAIRDLQLTKAIWFGADSIYSDSLIADAARELAPAGDSYAYQALYYNSLALHRCDSLAPAILALGEAEYYARSAADHLYLGRIRRAQAEVYARTRMLHQESERRLAARQSFLLAGRPRHAAWETAAYAANLFYLDKNEEAIATLAEIPDSILKSDPTLQLLCYKNLADHYNRQIRLDSLRVYFDAMLPFQDKMSQYDLSQMGVYALNLGSRDSALMYLSLSYDKAGSQTDTLNCRFLEYGIYTTDKDYPQALQALKDCTYGYARFFEETNSSPFSYLVMKNQMLKLTEAQLQHAHDRILSYSLITIACLLILVLFFIIAYFRKRASQRKLAEEILINDIKLLQKSVEAKSAEIDAMTHEKSKLAKKISDLSDEMAKSDVRPLESPLNHLLEKLQTRALKQKTSDGELASVITDLRSKQMKKAIIEYINASQQDILSRLKDEYPQLTDLQLDTAMWYFFGMTASSIALIRDQKNSNVYNIKSKMRLIIERGNGPSKNEFLKFL